MLGWIQWFPMSSPVRGAFVLLLLAGASCATSPTPADPAWDAHFTRASNAYTRRQFARSTDEAAEALRLLRDDPAHRRDRALVQRLLALSLAGLGRRQDAESILREVLAYRVEAFGDDSPEAAVSRQDLAVLYVEAEVFERAKPLNQQALEVLVRTPGTAMHVASCLNTRAIIARHEGRLRDAEVDLRTGLEILGRSGPGAASFAPVLQNTLAVTLGREGRSAEAVALHQLALGWVRRTEGPGAPDIGLFTRDLADLMRREGHLAEAEALLVQSVESLSASLGPDNFEVRESLLRLAETLAEEGQRDAAAAARKRAAHIEPPQSL